MKLFLFFCICTLWAFVQSIESNAEFRIENQPLDEVPEIPVNTKNVIIRNTTLASIEGIKFDVTKNLDLSRNLISSISQKTLQSTYLISINLSANVIAEYEVYAFTVSPLRQLDLSHNHLRKLPSLSAKPLLELQTLHLDNNRIEVIPEGFFEFLFKLEVFTARDNYLKVINLRPLYYLQHVELSHNYLQHVTLSNPKVTDLNLSYNDLEIANITGLNQCTSLLSLDLSQNPIGNLTAIQSPNLEELRLANMKIITSGKLPALTKLKILDFSDNDYPDFYNLEALPELNLLLIDGNKLNTLNFSLPMKLTYIGINDNAFSCAYLRDLIPSLRSKGLRLYFRLRSTETNVQGIRCTDTEDIEEKIEICRLDEEDFVYAWHTSVSATICLLLAITYMSILWKYKMKIRKIKDQENSSKEESIVETFEIEGPFSYNNLLIKYNNDT